MNYLSRMRKVLFWVFTIVSPVLLNAQSSSTRLKEHVMYLASDALKGRYPGTQGDSLTASYIESQFQKLKLKSFSANGLQNFTVVISQKAGAANSLVFQQKKYFLGEDFAVFPFSSNASLRASVVFAGMGIETSQPKIARNDYASADVKGKWVLLFRSFPDDMPNVREYRDQTLDRAKVLLARDKGAAGVIFVNLSSTDSSDELVKIDNRDFSVGIPVIQLKRKVADNLIGYAGACDSLEHKVRKSGVVAAFSIPVDVTANTEIVKNETVTHNVVAMLEGSDSNLKQEYVVIGAHYDHLGMGGANTSSRQKDTVAVHNGADDNASGVAGMLELARLLSKQKTSRSIIFVAFSAEEMGIIGSGYFVEHSPVALDKITAMINLDMIGNLRDSILQVGGSGTSVGADSILKLIAKGLAISPRLSPEGYGPSDHASFYAKSIPVFFLNTGVTATYHTPADDANLLNYNGLSAVVDYTERLALRLANQPKRPVFTEAGARTRQGGTPRYKVTLGIMPDVTAGSNKGLRAEMVIPGKPAYKAGLKTGDVIIAVKGQQVLNIEEYMLRLTQLHAGELVEVEVMRGNTKIKLYVQL